jgi:hypothetical protein
MENCSYEESNRFYFGACNEDGHEYNSAPISGENVESVEDDEPELDLVKRPWLAKYWATIVNFVKGQITASRDGIPDFYDRGTFWINAACPILNRSIGAIVPEDFYTIDTFFWDPTLMRAAAEPSRRFRLSCPSCKSKNTSVKEYNRPRWIYGLFSPYLLLTRRFECKDCNQTFNPHDLKVLESLPSHLRSLFPAYLTHRSGLDNNLLTFMRGCFNKGMK